MSLDDDVLEMGKIPLFQQLEYDAIRQMALSGETRILRRGDTLFVKGETSDSGYVLLNGVIELLAPEDSFAPRVLEPPVLIGESALLTESERRTTAIARAPCSVLKIHRNLFRRILRDHPRSARSTKTFLERSLRQYSLELSEFFDIK